MKARQVIFTRVVLHYRQYVNSMQIRQLNITKKCTFMQLDIHYEIHIETNNTTRNNNKLHSLQYAWMITSITVNSICGALCDHAELYDFTIFKQIYNKLELYLIYNVSLPHPSASLALVRDHYSRTKSIVVYQLV